MSDFLSSLRGAATAMFQGDDGTLASRRSNDVVRASPEYRQAASNRVSAPQSFAGFHLRDNYSAQQDAAQGRAYGLFSSDVGPSRSVAEQVRDTSLDVTSGFVGGALNLVSLAASGKAAVDRAMGRNTFDAGVPISQFAESTTNFLGSLKTQEGQDAQAAYGVTSDVLTQDNRDNYDAQVAAGANSFLAGAGRIGADVVDVGRNLLTQPEALSSGVSQGIGSLLLGGPVAKGGTAVATAGAKALAARGLMSPRLAAIVAESVEQGAMTGSIAAMEAGGAYSQAANQIMGMSHEDLVENSPQYAALINQGVDQATARNQIASRAGSIAAAIQAPIAAATGKMVAGFEASPFAGRTVRGALQNIGKETIEEGIQSFSGGLASNTGVRLTGDQSLDMAEGLGQGLAEGSIFGAGTAGVFAGPNVAVGAVERGVAGAKKLASTIYERGKSINEANAITPEVAAAAVREVTQPTEAVKPEPSIDPAADMAELERFKPRLDPLGQQFDFNRETFEPQSDIEAQLIAALPPENVDIWDVMQMASNGINSNNTTPEQKTDLAILIDRLEGQVTSDALAEVDRLKDEVTPGGTVAQELIRIVRAQESVANNFYMQKAQRSALKSAPEVTAQAVEDISTPEGRKAA